MAAREKAASESVDLTRCAKATWKRGRRMRRIDLHIHTTASDGTDTPAQAVEKAKKLGLAAIAVTDHDSAAGVPEAMEAGAMLGLEVVPGVELSTDWRGHRAHLLGYYIDPVSPALEPALNWAVTERVERNEKIVALFQKDGFDISIPELEKEFPGAVLGRPHMAEHLLRKGYVSSVKEAFDRYLADGMPYFLPKGRIGLERAVDLIRRSGGVAVLAHPLQYGHDKKTLEEFLEDGVRFGVSGLEAVYSQHSPEDEALVRGYAQRLGLCVTGGSDYHGTRKPGLEMGSGYGFMEADYSLLEGLRAARKNVLLEEQEKGGEIR